MIKMPMPTNCVAFSQYFSLLSGFCTLEDFCYIYHHYRCHVGFIKVY